MLIYDHKESDNSGHFSDIIRVVSQLSVKNILQLYIFKYINVQQYHYVVALNLIES